LLRPASLYGVGEGVLFGTLPADAGARLAYTLRASRANYNCARESLATRGAAYEDTLTSLYSFANAWEVRLDRLR